MATPASEVLCVPRSGPKGGSLLDTGSVTQGSDRGGCGGGPSAGEGARGPQSAPTAALVAGTAAMRNTKRGSWYVEALTQVFSERACDMHVADMLVKVSVPPCFSLALVFTVFLTLPLVLGS